MNRAMDAKEWMLLIALAILWGGTFFFAELALDSLGPLTLATGRVGIGAGAVLVAIGLSGQRLPRAPADWAAFAVMGALNNAIPFALIAWGQTRIESGLAAILNATTPLFTVLLAHAMTRDERLTAQRLAGVLAGIAGVAVLIGPQVLAGLGGQALAQAAVLAAALSYACAGIWGRRFRGLAPGVAAAGMLTCSTLMLLPAALILERPWQASPGGAAIGAVLALGLFCTALAYVLYFRILATAGATNLLLVTFLIPVSALALGMALLGERPGWTAFAGMVLIFAGLAGIDGRVFRLVRRGRGQPQVQASGR